MEGIKETLLKFLRIDNLVDNLSGYVEARVNLLKIEIKEDIAKVLSKGLVHAAIILFIFLFLIFMSLGVAHYLNYVLQSEYYGYWIVSGIYLLLFLTFMIFRGSIHKKFEKYFSDLIKSKEE